MPDGDSPAHEVLRIPFALTRTIRDPRGTVRRLKLGEVDGRRTWTFDLVIDRRETSSNDNTATNYSAAVVELESRIETRLAISRRGPFRQPAELDAPKLTVGTPGLQKRFEVRGTSSEIAAELLDDSLCGWFLGPGRGLHYEIVHQRVLAYGWRRFLGGDGPLRAALALAAQLHLRRPTL